MNKKEKDNDNKFPVELPSRNSETKRSPIVDVTENEIFPLGFNNIDGNRKNSGVQSQSPDNVSEIIATETESDLE